MSMLIVAASLLVASGDVLTLNQYDLTTDEERREIALTLTESDAAQLSKLSMRAPDHKLAIIVDGVVVQMPTLKGGPLTGRGVSLTFSDVTAFRAAKAAFQK